MESRHHENRIFIKFKSLWIVWIMEYLIHNEYIFAENVTSNNMDAMRYERQNQAHSSRNLVKLNCERVRFDCLIKASNFNVI